MNEAICRGCSSALPLPELDPCGPVVCQTCGSVSVVDVDEDGNVHATPARPAHELSLKEHRRQFPKPPESYRGPRPAPDAELTAGTSTYAARAAARLAQLRKLQPATAAQVAPAWGTTRQTAQTALAALEKRGAVMRKGSVLVNGTRADLWIAVG